MRKWVVRAEQVEVTCKLLFLVRSFTAGNAATFVHSQPDWVLAAAAALMPTPVMLLRASHRAGSAVQPHPPAAESWHSS